MSWTSVKRYIPLLSIIILASLLRFVYLDRIPNAIGGDELHYVMTAKSVWLTGHDISGSWNPWSLLWFRYPPNEHQAELPYLLHLLVSAHFSFSLLLIKLPFALLSVGIVVIIFAVASELFGVPIGVASATAAAINPWLIVMGRSAYEATPAMFFYLLALWMIIRTKKWRILWTIVPLVFAFYSYIATKVILVPFVAGISLLAYSKHGKKYLTQYVILCAFALLLAGGFYVLTKLDPSGSRLGDLFLPQSPAVAEAVNHIRKTAIASPLLSLIINKYTVYFQLILPKLFRIFSPSYLFVQGDQFFLPGRQSFFYYLDAPFLFIGTVWMFAKHRNYAWALWLLILIGAIPQLINTNTGDFSIHLTMLFPFVLPFIGAGIVETVRSVPKRISYWLVGCFIVLYAMSLANFSVIYFSQYPLVGKDNFSMRTLTRYLRLAKAHHVPAIVYTTSAPDVFQKYIVYSDGITKQTIPQYSSMLWSPPVTLDGVQFVPCGEQVPLPSETATRIYDAGCGKTPEGTHTSITTLADGGETYKIFGDAVCRTYQLKRYPDHFSFNMFDIEHLSEKQFCETYINQR